MTGDMEVIEAASSARGKLRIAAIMTALSVRKKKFSETRAYWSLLFFF